MEIRRLLAQGMTKQQVLDRLVEDYGPNVLAEPKASGFNAVAYAVPAGAVLGLGTLALVLLPRWRRARAAEAAADAGAPQAPELSAADAQRLNSELARYGA